MSKVSRSVQAGFANGERKLKQRWERAKEAKSEDQLSLVRKRLQQIKPLSPDLKASQQPTV